MLLVTLNGEVRTVGQFLAVTGDASVARSLSLELCTLFIRADKMLTCPLLCTPWVMVQTVSSGQGFDMPLFLRQVPFLDKAVVCPLFLRQLRRARTVQTVQKTRIPQRSSSGGS